MNLNGKMFAYQGGAWFEGGRQASPEETAQIVALQAQAAGR